MIRQASKDVTDSPSPLHRVPIMCGLSSGKKIIREVDTLFLIEAASHDSFVGSVLIKLVQMKGQRRGEKVGYRLSILHNWMFVFHTYDSAFVTPMFLVRHTQTLDTPIQVRSHRVDELKGLDKGQSKRPEVMLVIQRLATEGKNTGRDPSVPDVPAWVRSP